MTLRLERITSPTIEVESLWNEFTRSSTSLRGASTLLEGIGDLASLCESGALWLGSDTAAVSLAVVEERVLKVLFVTRSRRGAGLGRATLALVREATAVDDAWALPGDRASKSLYESIGWRARLLTMRGD